ncbi:hypothetical protein ACXAUS_000126 [Clostridium sporogenes]|uniref:hypothetical protein n=1 Tax=Clostridium sporogenes TaxID=1509 RepID=UPI002900AF8A|nr:hypothetical protein [Clostridium botulinum]
MYGLCREDNWIEAIRQCYKYNLLDINLDLLGLENILLDYSNIYVRILNVLYSIDLGLLDEENFLIDNMGEIKNAIKYKNT